MVEKAIDQKQNSTPFILLDRLTVTIYSRTSFPRTSTQISNRYTLLGFTSCVAFIDSIHVKWSRCPVSSQTVVMEGMVALDALITSPTITTEERTTRTDNQNNC